MNINNHADEVETTFYFLTQDPRPLKDDVMKSICKRFESVTGSMFYAMRSGPSVQKTESLAEEIKDWIPEQANFFVMDVKNDLVSLLSQRQRDLFVEALQGEGEGAEKVASDTIPQSSYDLAERIIELTEGEPESELEML